MGEINEYERARRMEKLRSQQQDLQKQERQARLAELRRKQAEGKAATRKPEDPKDFLKEESTTDAVIRGATRGLLGVAELIVGIDPFAPIKRKVGMDTNLEQFRAITGPALEAAGIDIGRTAPSGGRRLAEKLSEEAAAAVIPGSVIFREARTAARIGRAGPFLRSVAEKPIRFLMGEAASVAGSSVGRTAAPEVPGAQLAFGVLGGVGPGMFGGTSRRVYERASMLRRSSREARAGAQAAQQVQEAAGDIPRALSKIDEADSLAGQIPGLEASGGQATRDPGLMALENATAARNTTLDLQLQLEREQGQTAVVNALAEKVGNVADDREVMEAVVDAQANALSHSLDDQIKQSHDAIETMVERGTRGRSPEDIAELARTELQREANKVFEPIEKQYKAIDTLGENLGATFDATPIREAVNTIKSRATRAEGIALPRDLVESMQEIGFVSVSKDARILTGEAGEAINIADIQVLENVAVPFKELRGLNRRLNREISSARINRTAISEGRLLAFRDMKKAIRSILDTVEDSSEYPELAKAYRLANRQFEQAAERFRDGVVGKVLEPQRSPPAATATMGFFFKKGHGSREAAQAFKAAAKDNPELNALMDDYIVSQAWEATQAPGGRLSQRGLELFKSRHRAALAEFPSGAERVESLERLVKEADARNLGRERTLAEFQSTIASQFVKQKNIRSAVDLVLKSPDPVKAARELRQQLGGNPDAVEGAARIFWSELQRRALRYGDLGVGVNVYFEPQTFAKLADEFAPVLRVLHGEDHVRRLETLVKGAELAYAGRIPRTARNVQRSLLEDVPLSALYNQIYGVRLRAIRGAVALRQFLKNLDLGETQAILDAAISNRQIMRDLLTRVTPKNERQIIRRLRGHLISLGYRVDMEEEEQKRSASAGGS